MTKLKFLTLLAFILILAPILAQESPVAKFEKVPDLKELTLKISFHSWGEDRTTELYLDQYFPVKRDPNSRYIFLAPPEISVKIDQDQGIAYLKAYQNWAGTKDIIFSLTNIYSLEQATSDLQKYKESITQQRAPAKVKKEFQDLPPYHLFEKILDDLEAQKAEKPEIKVTKTGENIKITVAKELNLDLDIQTLTEEKLPTLKPRISISIQPEPKAEEAAATASLSVYLFIPLFLIILTLLIMSFFYIQKNRGKLKERFFKKKVSEKPFVNKLTEYQRDLTEIQNKLSRENVEKSTSDLFNVIKRFYNILTPIEYQFSYSEVKETQFEKNLSDGLKKDLCGFSRTISDIRFSGKPIEREELKKLITEVKRLVNKTAAEEKILKLQKQEEEIRNTLPVRAIKYIADSFTEGADEKKIYRIKEKLNLKRKTRDFLHRLGILQTLAEKELERKLKFHKKLNEIKEKLKQKNEEEHQKKLEKQREVNEKHRRKLLKLKEKQRLEKLKLLEIQRKLREKQRLKEEKLRRRKARIRAVRDYFHDRFGLFKTVRDFEKELEEKRKAQLEKEKLERLEKRKRKRAVLNFLHFLRLYKTPEEKHEKELILKRAERLEKERKARIRAARKEKVLNLLHSLKLYRTPEEVRKERDKRLRILREKERAKEEKYRLEELKKREGAREKEKAHLAKLEEKHKNQIEKAQKKELRKKQREEYVKEAKRKIKNSLHDYFGFYKTPEEITRKREKKYHEELEKSKEKEKQRLVKLEKKKRRGEIRRKERLRRLVEKHRKEEIRKAEKQRKKVLRKEFYRRKRHEIKKFLHNSFGLYKTPEELKRQKEKIRRELMLKAQKRKLKELRRKEEKQRKKALRKEFYRRKRHEIKKFLHNSFGLYKTPEELRKQKEKIRQDLERKSRKQKLKEQRRKEKKFQFKKFLHDHLGLFKTQEELQIARLARKRHRVELEQKIENTLLRALASRLQRKKLTPEQEIKILMQLEEEALRKRDISKAEEIKKRINKLYKKVKGEKTSRLSLYLNKISNKWMDFKDSLFSQTQGSKFAPSFLKKLSLPSSKIEQAKVDQINYLVDKAEIELKRKRRNEAVQYYQRAIYLYKSLNRSSKQLALPNLLKIKNEITTLALEFSFEKAFNAMHLGQNKKAESFYKDIDVNFQNLPLKEKEKLYDKKTELYQKLQPVKRESKFKKIKINFLRNLNILKEKFSKKEVRFYPVSDKKFQPKPLPEFKTPSSIKEKPLYKESLKNYILAKKPKFTSIKTELSNFQNAHNLAQRLFSHLNRAESHLQKKNHEKAHESYHRAVSLFKETDLKPEIRDHAYNRLQELKQKILHVSLHNLARKTQASIKNENLEEAKKHHQMLGNIYTHLSQKPPESLIIHGVLALEKEIERALIKVHKGDLKEAQGLYQKINNSYNNLTPQEKKIVYSKLIILYSELLKKAK